MAEKKKKTKKIATSASGGCSSRKKCAFLVRIFVILLLFVLGAGAVYFVFYVPKEKFVAYEEDAGGSELEKIAFESLEDNLKREFIEIVFLEWEIFNKLNDFFLEREYMSAMRDFPELGELSQRWRILDSQNVEMLDFYNKQLIQLKRNCADNFYCRSHKYGIFAIDALSEMLDAERRFYLEESGLDFEAGAVGLAFNRNRYADLTRKFQKELPDFLDFFKNDHLKGRAILRVNDINRMVQLGNFDLKTAYELYEITLICADISGAYHESARYKAYCVDELENIRKQVANIMENADASTLSKTCVAEKYLESTQECNRTKKYILYIQNLFKR